MKDQLPLQGDDRYESGISALGGVIKGGSSSERSLSILAQIRNTLRVGDASTAGAYLESFHDLALDIITTYIEWGNTWASFLAEKFSEDTASAIALNTYENWRQSLIMVPKADENETVTLLLHLMDPGHENRDGQALAVAALATLVNQAPLHSYREVLRAMVAGRLEAALEALDLYAVQVRDRHDMLALYIWAYASAVHEEVGQAFAEEGLLWSLSHCSFYDRTWDLMETLDPSQIAQAMADELRGHFSGPDRQGSVEVIEEPDRYRLVFDPCGSGGAMRRALGKDIGEGFAVFAEASPATWGRTGEVPIYCAHCAQNELTSLRRLGYPAWVTEFDPNASKPCGWTVYKDPASIPEQYFARLGAKKDISKLRPRSGRTQRMEEHDEQPYLK